MEVISTIISIIAGILGVITTIYFTVKTVTKKAVRDVVKDTIREPIKEVSDAVLFQSIQTKIIIKYLVNHFHENGFNDFLEDEMKVELTSMNLQKLIKDNARCIS
jgi:hypothetical protein